MGLFGEQKKEREKEFVQTPFKKPAIKKFDGWIDIDSRNEKFFGQYIESENGKYLVAFRYGHKEYTGNKNKWIDGEVYLIENGQTILWKKTLEMPNSAHVSNEGVVAVEDWLNPQELSGSLVVFDKTGNGLMEKRVDANIGASNISPDGKYAVITTCNPDNSIYLLDLVKKEISWKKKNLSKKILTGILFKNDKIVFGMRTPEGMDIEYELLMNGELSEGSKKDLDTQKSLEKGEMKPDDAIKIIKLHLSSNNTSEIRKGLEDIRKILYLKDRGKKKSGMFEAYLADFSEITPILITLLEKKEFRNQGEVMDLIVRIWKNKKELINDHKDEIIEYITKNSKKYREGVLLGTLAEVNPEFTEIILPILKDNLTNSKHWNARRFAIFNLGIIGKKYPDKIKDVIPVIAEYIEKPEKLDQEIRQFAKDDEIAQIDINVVEGMRVDPKTWIKDAAIDFMGDFGKKYPELIKDYVPLLEDVSKNAESPYSRKKAAKALDNISSK